jgi:hypothetical protein
MSDPQPEPSSTPAPGRFFASDRKARIAASMAVVVVVFLGVRFLGLGFFIPAGCIALAFLLLWQLGVRRRLLPATTIGGGQCLTLVVAMMFIASNDTFNPTARNALFLNAMLQLVVLAPLVAWAAVRGSNLSLFALLAVELVGLGHFVLSITRLPPWETVHAVTWVHIGLCVAAIVAIGYALWAPRTKPSAQPASP